MAIPSFGENVEELENACRLLTGMQNSTDALGQTMQVSHKVKSESNLQTMLSKLADNPHIPLLGIYPRN